jgi:hypothetical protein
MGSYCKAYLVKDLSEYPRWAEKPVPKPSSGAGSSEDGDGEERYLFLQENLVVTDGIFLDEGIVFDEVTPEWERFCTERLSFEVPEVNRIAPAEVRDEVGEPA